MQSNKNNSCIAFLKIKITEDVEDYCNCIIPPFFIIILLELIFVQIVGLGSLFLSATNSEEHHPGRDCDTGSESRLEQHPPLDTHSGPQFPMVRITETWVAADSGLSRLPCSQADTAATSSSPTTSSRRTSALSSIASPTTSPATSPATATSSTRCSPDSVASSPASLSPRSPLSYSVVYHR